MGLGDELMAAGRAAKLAASVGRPVAIVDRDGRARQHPIWDGNPAIDAASDVKLLDCPGARPYIQRWIGRSVVFNLEHRPIAGRVYLTKDEQRWADEQMLPQEFIVIEPVVRAPSSPNKDWGFDRWAEVAAAMPLPVYQLGPDDRPQLPGARRLVTPDVRLGAAVVAKATLVLCTEGGMHHLAAALGRPAVVIFGAFTPPLMTGYEGHHWIHVETPTGYCGRYLPCEHCREAMASISPALVAGVAIQMLGRLCTTAPTGAH